MLTPSTYVITSIKRFLAVGLILNLLFIQTAMAANAVSASYSLNEDSPKTITLRGGGNRNETVTYSISTPPSNGQVTLNGNLAIYSPSANYYGEDSFYFKVTGSSSGSATAKVSLTVNSINDAPVPTSQTVTTDNLTPVTITLQATDVDGDPLTYSVRNGSAFGTVSSVSGNEITFTPTSGYEGTTSFNFNVSDGARTASGTITVNVTRVPQAPEITVATVKDQSVSIKVPTTDASGQSWTVNSWSSPSHGSLTRTSTGWTYRPTTGFEGMDSFPFVLTQGSSHIDALARINVTPPTGIAQTPIVQLGLNFLNLTQLDYLDDYEALGVQAVRQVGDGDTTMGTVELGDGHYRDPAAIAAVRAQYNEAGIQVVDTLLNTMFASCGTDPDNPVETLTEDCKAYIDYVATYIDAITPAGLPAYIEAGNELFHWVTHPEFTVEEQAMISAYAVDTITGVLAARGRETVWYTPSIMINSEMTWDWWKGFTAALDTPAVPLSSSDVIYQNYHYYDSDSRYQDARNEFEAEGMWEDSNLMVLTEFGFSDAPDYERHEVMNSYEKAAAMVRLMFMAYGAGDSAVYYHTPIYSDDPNNEGIRATGLIDEDGTWEPAAYSYQFVAQELLPFVQITDLSQEDQHVYQVIMASGSTKYVVWGEGSFTVPSGVSRYAHLANSNGNLSWSTLSAGSTLTLSEWPQVLN